MTAIVGLVLVSDSDFVELQLILNGLTGKNVKIFSFLKFFCFFKEIEAPLAVLLIQVSIKGLLTSGTHVSFIFLFFFQGSGKHHLLCWEFILPRCLPCLGNPHHTHQVDRSAGGDKEEAKG